LSPLCRSGIDKDLEFLTSFGLIADIFEINNNDDEADEASSYAAETVFVGCDDQTGRAV
jgi:hypothetical protein